MGGVGRLFAMPRKAATKKKDSSANLGFEAKLWLAADKYISDAFRNDLHPDRKADYLLANSPFTVSDTALRGSAFFQSEASPQVVSEAKDNFRKDDDVRWKYGPPPGGNANFGWIQHIVHHLAPNGMAGFVPVNGAMSSDQSGDCNARSAMKTPKAKPQSLPRQCEIRKALIEADLEKMARLVAELHGHFAESAKLELAINANLNGLDYAR